MNAYILTAIVLIILITYTALMDSNRQDRIERRSKKNDASKDTD